MAHDTKNNLMHGTVVPNTRLKIGLKNRIALGIYIPASLLSLISVCISFFLFLVVPAMYFFPENFIHETDQ